MIRLFNKLAKAANPTPKTPKPKTYRRILDSFSSSTLSFSWELLSGWSVLLLDEFSEEEILLLESTEELLESLEGVELEFVLEFPFVLGFLSWFEFGLDSGVTLLSELEFEFVFVFDSVLEFVFVFVLEFVFELELVFVFVLYLFDTKPENRIAVQYTKK